MASPLQPSGRFSSETESRDSVMIVIEGSGDKTRRPRRPNIPLFPPYRPPTFPPPDALPPS